MFFIGQREPNRGQASQVDSAAGSHEDHQPEIYYHTSIKNSKQAVLPKSEDDPKYAPPSHSSCVSAFFSAVHICSSLLQ